MGIFDATDTPAGEPVAIAAPADEHMLTLADIEHVETATAIVAQCTTIGCQAYGIPVELLVDVPDEAVWTGTACGRCGQDSAHRPVVPE